MYYEEEFLKLLSDELDISLGCTEPAAIALAASTARKYSNGENIVELNIFASPNVIKNAMHVNLPGAECRGIKLAAAVGAMKAYEKKDLRVLEGMDHAIFKKAMELIDAGKVHVHIADTEEKIYIKVVLKTEFSQATAVIETTHTNIARVEVDGKIVDCTESNKKTENMDYMCLESIWEFINKVQLEKLSIIRQSIELNKAIGEEGLRNNYGLRVGKTILNWRNKGIISDDVMNHATALTAAGSDARMAGSDLLVMCNTGSGNQGITATLPVVAIGEKMGLDEELLIRAVALSNIITIFIKQKFGRLSTLCGATVAAIGASCGITYLLGGGITEFKAAIQNMIGNLTGMLCDGAKAGCALKVSTSTYAAVHSALLAVDGLSIQFTDGIVEDSPENSIKNLCLLGNEGTLKAEKMILSIMLNKDTCKSMKI